MNTPSPLQGFCKCLTALLLVALLALPVCGGALATSSSVKVTVVLTGYASFEAACKSTDPSFNPAEVTELVIVGQGTAGDWTYADSDYLRYNFTKLETLDMSGHTGGYSDPTFENCTFQKVRLRENITLITSMFLNCTNLTTLAVGDRPFDNGVIDLRGCNASALTKPSTPFNGSGITHVRLPADANLGSPGTGNYSPFEGCTNLTTLALGDRPLVDGVVDLTGYSFGNYVDGLFFNCTSIERARLPANVIPSNGMFSNCTSLTTLALGDRPFVDDVVDLTGYSFGNYEPYLFSGCTGIDHARLPADVPLSEGMFATSFENKSNLSLTFLGGNAPTPSINDPFYNLASGGMLYYPQSASGYEKDKFYPNHLGNLVRQPFVPLAITEPSDQAIVPGQNAAFTVTVTSSQPDSYQWQILNPTSGIWTDVTDDSMYTGATTSRLSLTNVQQNLIGAQYRCVLKNDRQLLVTRTASLTAPTPTPTPTPTPAPAPTPSHMPPPKTGDAARPLLWTGMSILTLACALGLILADKRRRVKGK